jgi:hypothetical protein
MFIERTGMKTPWADKTKEDLARVRALLLEQPPGEGGLPPSASAKPLEPKPAEAAPPPSAAGAPAPAPPDEAGPPKEPTRRTRNAPKAQ